MKIIFFFLKKPFLKIIVNSDTFSEILQEFLQTLSNTSRYCFKETYTLFRFVRWSHWYLQQSLQKFLKSFILWITCRVPTEGTFKFFLRSNFKYSPRHCLRNIYRNCVRNFCSGIPPDNYLNKSSRNLQEFISGNSFVQSSRYLFWNSQRILLAIFWAIIEKKNLKKKSLKKYLNPDGILERILGRFSFLCMISE